MPKKKDPKAIIKRILLRTAETILILAAVLLFDMIRVSFEYASDSMKYVFAVLAGVGTLLCAFGAIIIHRSMKEKEEELPWRVKEKK